MPAKANRGRRLALIIAGSTYSDPTLQKLRAPGKDASELAGVLGDPAIGGFEVDTLLDAPAERVKSGIFDFCEKARPGDLLMLYLSCHGVLDDRGRLYYAATDTQSRRLGLTGVPSEWLNDQLEDCKARREILILDCCHSGAFAKGAKGESALALKEKLGGRGRAVLTASRATEYSFEGEAAVGDDVRSVFTNAIVQGLRSGDADRNKDGLVTVEDLYHYVYETVRQAEPRQTPEWWVTNGEGEFVVAHGVRGAIIEPVPLSKHVTEILESPHAEVRESGVKVLARLLEQGAPGRAPTARQSGLALSARQRLQQIIEDDLPRIAEQARAALSSAAGEATANLEPAPEAERVVSLDPTYRDATTRLETARAQAAEATRLETARAHAAEQKDQASPAHKPGDTLNGQVLGADHVWHPLAQTGPPPGRYWKGFIWRFCWMYFVFVIIALLISTWIVLSDYLDKVLAAPDIPVVAPSYVKQSAIIAAIVAVLMDFMVASLRYRKQR